MVIIINSSIESHMLDQEEMSIKSKRTKPRAIVSTTFEVFTFKTPYSLMTKNAVKKDKQGRKTMEREKEGVEKNKHCKGKKRKAEEITARKSMEELKRAYKRKIHLYKTKYKVQKLKKEIPMEEAAET
uniref:Uncharacterized protein n=1 Tax=Lactuca sativa TaxID=4236 RepID=A0A9R1V5M0_LACSA|nr:hypothetical protein LSAT_V11C600305920 [Lactuca sativa]